MARSRRKNGGPTRGRYRLKKLGKGWAAHRRERGHAKPIDRSEKAATPAGSAATATAPAKPKA